MEIIMVKYVCGVAIPDEFNEIVFETPIISESPVKKIKTVSDPNGSISSIEYYKNNILDKKIIYRNSFVEQVLNYNDGKIYSKQFVNDGLINSEYFYKKTGELDYILEYEYLLNKISAINQTFGLIKRRAVFKYDFMDRISERIYYCNNKLLIDQHYFYDGMGRVSGYKDKNCELFVEKFTKDNKLHTYKITDKMDNEIIIINNFYGNDYIETKVSVNGVSTIVNDINYVDNIMTRKPTQSMDELDLIIAKLFSEKEQGNSLSTKRSGNEPEARLESNLVNIIEYKSKIRPLPIALRKRVLYQQSLESHG